MKNPVSTLRKVGIYEGISYLALLGIAMPLKYGFDMPLAVKICGSAHGALFVLLCVLLAYTFFKARWTVGRAGLVFVASLLPFGPFLIDKKMRRFEDEYLAVGSKSHPERVAAERV